MARAVEQAPNTWKDALRSYCYPVDLSRYEGAAKFPNYFKRIISGDRNSTIEFENYFRKEAPHSSEVYFEVVFWKLYSFEDQTTATNIIEKIKPEPAKLHAAITRFVNSTTIKNLKYIRQLLGMRVDDGVLAVPLTFPAFLSPEKFPMVDTHVADWINRNLEPHNRGRQTKLTRFASRESQPKARLTDKDFPSYENWVHWCREVAPVLTKRTSTAWRARDVEMAVFSAETQGLELETL